MNKEMTDKQGLTCVMHQDIGVRYARLTVLEHKRGMFTCICDCGQKIEVRAANVKSGRTKGCTFNGWSNHTREWLNEPITTPDLTIDEVRALINRATKE